MAKTIVMLGGSGRSTCTQIRTTLTNLSTSVLSTLLSNLQLASSSCNTNGTTSGPSQLPPLLCFISASTSAFCHRDDVPSPRPPQPLVPISVGGGGGGVSKVPAGGGTARGGSGGWLRRGRGRGEMDDLTGDALEVGYDGGVAGGGHGALLGEEVVLGGEPGHNLPPPCLLSDHPILLPLLDHLQEPLLHRLLPLHHLPHQPLEETPHLLPRRRPRSL